MINENLIFLNIDIATKTEAINYLTKKLLSEKYVQEKGKDFKNQILNREQTISTDMGNGIAIPHAKSKDIAKPFVAYLRVKNLILWNEEKNSMVSMIFMIGVPNRAENGVHLKMLSNLARKLIDEDFLATVKNVNDNKKIVELLEDEEA
ncbi:PTS sugar transporter subunit IIA [Pediococcus inopinatus]|uniref:PTS sugar transporter subunit IIA n=1 Tax=Pediococcus inopinatus TaxID=114090 RepID=UPI002B25CAB3|nr:PTS sugar transporter subunit IIA [Pediococcus inopinatus]WPC18309.1 PTS sugar transporter subunit IIA [Pediococcus inopinatus]